MSIHTFKTIVDVIGRSVGSYFVLRGNGCPGGEICLRGLRNGGRTIDFLLMEAKMVR